jgi:drug/metabolite transporter (DMT)-like permease
VTAYLVFGERLNGIQLVGSAMILAGVFLLRVYEGWLEGRTRAAAGGAARPAATD